MDDHFLSRYLDAFDSIPGWFSPDACLIFMAYHQLLADAGMAGDALEIGVHHGLSAIGVAALRGEGRRFVAIDLFDEMQAQNISGSGQGNREQFLANMRRFYDDLSFLTTLAAHSATLRTADLGTHYSFCHIDGGHSAAETFADLKLCSAITIAGGLIALDDYFNPAFPGVGEASIRFALEHPGTLRPIAIGFNKALFQREPAPFDLNARFAEVFPCGYASRAVMWEQPVRLFDTAFRAFFDCDRSTPRRLVPAGERAVQARIEPTQVAITAKAGEAVSVPVQVTNLSRIPLAHGSSPFGLSYHLMTAERRLLQFDHAREWFTDPLLPGASRTVDVCVQVPAEPGTYALEFDIVWEGVSWMKDLGNPTGAMQLTAIGDHAAAPAEPTASRMT
ncbi:MAG TPA: class I SAM-dependent methyltransferase [Vicinamibacterales bacterium]|nr:class I SAM-dependent methyltransferase [Vicinamibacterales bacterium]